MRERHSWICVFLLGIQKRKVCKRYCSIPCAAAHLLGQRWFVPQPGQYRRTLAAWDRGGGRGCWSLTLAQVTRTYRWSPCSHSHILHPLCGSMCLKCLRKKATRKKQRIASTLCSQPAREIKHRHSEFVFSLLPRTSCHTALSLTDKSQAFGLNVFI